MYTILIQTQESSNFTKVRHSTKYCLLMVDLRTPLHPLTMYRNRRLLLYHIDIANF